MNEGTLFSMLTVATILFLLFVLFLLWLRLALETRLVMLGIALAVYAAWCGALSGPVSARLGRSDAVLLPADLPGGLIRVAAILVLGGVAAGLLHRPAAPTPPEPPANVPPSA